MGHAQSPQRKPVPSDSSEMSWCTNWHLCWQSECRAWCWGACGDHGSCLPNLEGSLRGWSKTRCRLVPAGWRWLRQMGVCWPQGWHREHTCFPMPTGSLASASCWQVIRSCISPLLSVLSEWWKSVIFMELTARGNCSVTPKQWSESCSFKGNQQ